MDFIPEYSIQKYKDLENYAISLENYDNNMKELRHDFKNILSSIAGYIRVDDIENLKRFFQKEILSVFAENTSISYISDTMKRIQSVELKSFLYEKILKASAINVVIHCEVNTKIIFNNVNIVDMIRVMGIYLDNAIEAAEESVGKEIWLYFIDDDTKLLIGIENTFDDSKMYFENIGQKGFSTKGKERGLGVCSARKILGKYKHVFLETSIENQLFKQIIIIQK